MKRLIYFMLPVSLRFAARRVYYLPFDVYESLTGKRKKGIPPRGSIFIGHGDYEAVGARYLQNFIHMCQLQPSHAVLDVGCGTGRMALPLAGYLNPSGSYDGFDVVKKGIDWCNKHIAPDHPNFHFRYTPIYNSLYNTQAGQAGNRFVFPYPDAHYDLVFYTSVFTHLLPADTENYLHETARVLKKGGYCFFTCFLWNAESEEALAHIPNHMTFPVNRGHYRLHSAQVDTANVAYQEEWIFEQLTDCGLVVEQVHYGQWCGREKYYDYQDIVVCRKTIKAYR